MRSLLFVPGDRPDRFSKATASGADALILDLEDSVSLGRKIDLRQEISEFTSIEQGLPSLCASIPPHNNPEWDYFLFPNNDERALHLAQLLQFTEHCR